MTARRPSRVRPVAVQAQTPPAKASPASWPDPVDTLRTATPKQVSGYRRQPCVLVKMIRRGCTLITPAHLDAAGRLRTAWDGATIGYTNGDPLAERTGRMNTAPMGPPRHAQARFRREQELRYVFAHVGPAAWGLIVAVVVTGQDVPAFARAEGVRLGHRIDPKVTMGTLLAGLDRLAEVLTPGRGHRSED
ncbi:MAG: hypothetical protein NVS2B11_05430 [Acetobacteraceae bacterium]